jgi:hypothetical protein
MMMFINHKLSSELNLMCLKTPDGPLTASQAFDKMEGYLSTLKKNKFYGFSKLEIKN